MGAGSWWLVSVAHPPWPIFPSTRPPHVLWLPPLSSYCSGVILQLQEHLGNRRFVGLSPHLPKNFMLSFLFLWSHSQETGHRCPLLLDTTDLTGDWLLTRTELGDGAGGSQGLHSEHFGCLPSYLTLLASRKSFSILLFLGVWYYYSWVTLLRLCPYHEHSSFLTLSKILKRKANWGEEKGKLRTREGYSEQNHC